MAGKWNASQSDLQSRILQRMKHRYALAIGLLVASAFVTFWLENHANSLKSSDYELINLSGRQRMLSQRLALVSVTDKSLFPADFDRQIQVDKIADEIQFGLRKILQSRFVVDDPAISKVYYQHEGVKDYTERLITLAKKNSGDLDSKILDLAYHKMIPLLDEATRQLQIRSELDFTIRERVALAAFIFTLTILFLELVFIFFPLIKEVQRGLNEVEELHTKALTQARLTAMGELTAMVGHELSNCLAIVKPTLSMLTEKWRTGTPEKTEQYLRRLTTQTERMERILSALKLQARDANHDPVTEVDLKKVVQESAHLLQERFKNNDVELQMVLDQRELLVNAKPGELYQVMNNLIANALDSVSSHKKNTGNWIRIEAGPSKDIIGGHFIRISDSGPGVPPELSEKIFDAFFTTKGAQGGTGLGLAVSRRIIEGLGGKLLLHTSPSESWFEIQIPYARHPREQAQA